MIDPSDGQGSPEPSERDVLQGLAADVYGDQNNAVIRSMSVATKQNPDLAAQAQQLGASTGVGADVASRNIEEVRRQQQLDQIRLKDLARTSPALAAHLSDPSFAAVAHDDVQNLMDSEEMWNGVRVPTGNPVSDVLPTSFWAKVASGFESARIQAEDEGLMRMAKQDPTKYEQALSQWQANQQKVQELPFQAEGWIAGTANVVGQQAYGAPRVMKSALVGASIGGTAGAVGGLGIFDWATIPAGIIAGGSAGAISGMATNTFGAESASTYFNMRQAGYEDGIATPIAYAVGAVNAGLEMGGLEFSSRMTRKAFSAAVRNIAGEKIGAAVAKKTTAAITKETIGKGIGTALVQGGLGTAAEATEEVFQNGSNFVAERIAYWLSGDKTKLRKPQELQQFISDSVDTFLQTIQSTALLQLPGMAAHIHNTYTNVRRAESTAKFMSGLMGKAVESKLRTRSPETFQRFMAAQADGTNAETLYVEASKMEELLDAAELPSDEENRLFPGVRAAIAAAKVDGGDISFPTAKFVTDLAGTKFGDAMVEHMRLDPNAPSLAEAREIAATAEQQRKEFEVQANKILEDKQQTDADFIESAQVVKDRMRQEVLAAGEFTPEQADELSTMGRNMIVNLAAKAGMTPEQYEAKYGRLQIFGERSSVAVASEDAQFDQAGQRRTDTPEFRSWFGDSKIVDAEGKPLVVYHGTDAIPEGAGFTTFVVGSTGNFGRGIYFSPSPEIAGEYAGQKTGAQILPVYVSLQNPLRVGWEDSFQTEVASALGLTLNEFQERMNKASRRGMRYEDFVTKSLQQAGFDGVIATNSEGKQYVVALDPKQIKSVNNRGTWSKTDPNILNQAAMSTRVPSGKTSLEDALSNMLLADFPAFIRDPNFVAKNLAKFKQLGVPIRIDEKATEAEQIEQVINHLASNLLWLHDQMDPELRARAKEWYVGGRVIVDWLAERHGISPMAAATIFAVLSPQKNWYENVGLGIRIADIVSTQQQTKMDAEMSGAYIASLKKKESEEARKLALHDAKKPKRGKAKLAEWEEKRAKLARTAKTAAKNVPDAEAEIAKIGDRTLGELLDAKEFELAAVFVRWFDQTKNDRTYPVISPEGGIGEPVKTAAGANAQIRYGGYDSVAKAISAYVDGRAENLFYLIGNEHKVRNFYNNLFNPKDTRFTTIDTHAIAAGYLMPLAGTDAPVMHGLGATPTSDVQGLGGAYAVFYEAYRRAAEARGIEPREMQSITWEAVRGMFEAADKKTSKAPVAAVWKRYVDGEIDLDTARKEVMEIAGGITTPSWVELPRDMKPQAGYSGVSREAADASAKGMAASSDFANIMFEVAPDPANTELKAKWDALTPERRQAISMQVAQAIIPKILEEYGVSGDMLVQVGGWKGDTNVAFAIRLAPGPLVRQIAQAVGYALSQEGMFSISETQFPGSTKKGLVSLELAAGTSTEQIKDLYGSKLWPLGIIGHSTVDGTMLIGLDEGVDAEALAGKISAELAGDARVVSVEHGEAWSSYDETRQSEAAGATDVAGDKGQAVQRRRLDAFRAEATSRVADAIGESGTFQQSAVAPGFYSALERSIGAIDANALTASGWRERLKGLVNKGEIKQDELTWSGLEDFLALPREGKVTKSEVAAFLKNNGVQVRVVTIGAAEREAAVFAQMETGLASAQLDLFSAGGMTPELEEAFREYEAMLENRVDDRERSFTLQSQIDNALRENNLSELHGYFEDSSAAQDEAVAQPKYERYTLPGGTNYREILLTLPNDALGTRNIMEGNKVVAVAKNDPFRSSHWDYPNVVAHIRVNDRVDANGKRILFVEEIQSDWAQAGRKKGFEGPEAIKDQEAAKAQLADVQQRFDDAYARLEKARIEVTRALRDILESMGLNRYEDIISAGERKPELKQEYEERKRVSAEYETAVEVSDRAQDEVDALSQELSETRSRAYPEKRILTAPFVTKTEGWLNLALKQIMLEAIKGNYDSVAFVNGEQSADRYDLAQQVSLVSVSKQADGRFLTYIEGVDGTALIRNRDGFSDAGQKAMTAEELEATVGKEVAKQAIEGKPNKDGWVDVRGDNLRVGGEGMKAFYDKIVPAAVNKLLKKVGGDKLGDMVLVGERRVTNDEIMAAERRGDFAEAERLTAIMERQELGRGESTAGQPIEQQQPGFDVTDAMRETVSGGLPLFQAAAGPSPRGAFDPRSLTLMLNKGADMSTFPHEMSHFYLTMLGRMASGTTVDPSVRADMDTLLSWFGVAGTTPEERLAAWNAMSVDQQRQYHEQFAYNFELYLFEGKSPSLEMQGVFDRFAAYLKRVYKSIRDELNETYRKQFGKDLPFLTPEIRGVMDRMLASDEQIKRAEAIRNMMPMFQTQEQAGMSDTEWAAYQAMQSEATQASITDLSRASIRQMQWLSNARSRILREMQAEHDERRKEIKSEVSKEVAARPAYRATRWFRSGEFEQADGTVVKTEGDHKINKTLAFEIIDAQPRETMIDYLNLPTGIFSEEGANPDEVAQMMGFTSGDQMLRALVSLKPMREEIDAETDRRLTAERGELNTPQAREAAIASALHNEARARFVATELRFVARATQPVRVMLEAARQVAAQIIGDKKLRDLKPNEFMAAESRAAKDASNAYSKEGAKDRKARYGNVSPEEVVVAAKRAQLMQNQLAAEATRAGGEVVKAVKYLRNVLSDANRKRMGADAADQIANILERFELRPMSRDEALRRATLATWITAQRDAGLEPDISPEVENEAFRVSYRDLTVQQFRDVVDAIKQIEYVAKNAQKLLVAARKAEFEAARDEIVASIETHAGDRKAVTRTPTTKLGKTLSALKGFATSHLKAAAIVRILDGGVDGGPLWEYLIRTSNERSDMETTMRAEATKFLSELFAPLFKMGRMGGAGVYFPTIDRSLNREARIAIALNMGNAGNIQRLLDGEGWSMEQIQPVLESLTQAEWEVVQGVWDYMESYRPKIAEKERRIYGKEPAWVEPQALTVKTAEGNEITLRGGYYPIKYDPMASMRAETMAEADEARRDLKAAGIAATTRRSFTKSRVREVTGRPLMYSLVGMYAGINDVIHDLSWHEWLIDANRLMRSDKFDNSVRTRYGPEYIRQLKDWIKDVAAGENQVTTEGERMLSWMRQNVSAAGLGFNLVSAAMQVTGFTNSFVRVGTAWVGRGIAATISNPKRAYAMVADKSEFMRNRSRTQFRELNELRNMVQDQSRADRTWRTGVYFLMMRMQQVVDVPTWIGAYEKALFEGREDADAVALADQGVIDSQGGGQLKDLSKIERGGPGLKLFTVFYSFMNTVYNQSKVLTMTEKNKGKLAARLIMLWVVPVVLNRMLKDALTPGDDDDDYWRKLPQRLAEDQLSYFMGSMVGVREFSEIAKISTGGKAFGYTGPSGVRKIGDVIKFAEQASQGEFDTAFRKTAINLLGDLSGAPSAQINRTIDGIDALIEGKTSNPLAPLTGFSKNR